MANRHRICDVAHIQIGYQLRSKPKGDPKGDTLLVQTGDVNSERTSINFEDALRFNPTRGTERQLLNAGDVLFMGKGTAPFACLVPEPPAPAIAGGMFFILRCDPDRIKPGFLVWFLNRRDALHKLMIASGTGVAMPVIRRSELESLEICIPAPDTQKRICDLLEIEQEERQLLRNLMLEKRTLVESVCRKMQNRGEL